MLDKKQNQQSNTNKNRKQPINPVPEENSIFFLQRAIGNQGVGQLFKGNTIQRMENDSITLDQIGFMVEVKPQVERQASRKGIDTGISTMNTHYKKIIEHCKLNEIPAATLAQDLNNKANIVKLGKIQLGYRVFFWNDPMKYSRSITLSGEPAKQAMAFQIWGLHEQEQTHQDIIFKQVTLDIEDFGRYGVT
ncbi:MAG: hypothetical protein JXJ04_20685 [Spirochaetales bacterium]|nr:hypothetical protein [Spirochaetales bacterium]